MEDLTGRQQFARNVAVSWSMHIIVLAAGFIVPRQIGDNLGAEALGIWDLGWGTVRYLSLASLGVAPSLNRYTALYRASGDHAALNRSVTAVFVWQSLIALLVAVVVLAASGSVQHWVAFENEAAAADAQVVLLLLGLTVSAKMIGGAAGGVITGCHRWDIQHTINAMQDFVLAICMVGILLLGGGLPELALTVFAGGVITASLRWYFVRRVCPEAQVSPRHWELKAAKKMLRFGGKSMIFDLQKVVIFQTMVFVLAATAGPAMVAIFNRGVALTRHCETIVRKVTTLFTPMTSGLIGMERSEEAHAFLLRAATYGMAVALPFMLLLLCFGDLILLLWMGPGYDNWTMLAILVSGTVWPIAQSGAVGVVKGFNAHGKLAIVTLLSIIVVLGCALPVASHFGWNEISAAMVVAVTLIVSRGLVVPLFLKARFGLSLFSYLKAFLFLPVFCNLPLLGGFVLARLAIVDENWLQAFLILTATGLVMLLVYWYWILDNSMREMVLKSARKLRKV